MALSEIFPSPLHTETRGRLLQTKEITLSGLANPLAKFFLLHDLNKEGDFPLTAFVTSNANEVVEYVRSSHLCAPTSPVLTFMDVTHANVLAFLKIAREGALERTVAIMSPQFLIAPCPPPKAYQESGVNIRKGETIDLHHFYNELILCGYRVAEDRHLKVGEYRMEGGMLGVFPFGEQYPTRVEFFDTTVESIARIDQDKKETLSLSDELHIPPCTFEGQSGFLAQYLPANSLLTYDELEGEEESFWETATEATKGVHGLKKLTITSFPNEDAEYEHLRYVSVTKYYAISDFINDIKERLATDWRIVLHTKNVTEVENILHEHLIPFSNETKAFLRANRGVMVQSAADEEAVPRSFQNTSLKIAVLTDREIFRVRRNVGAFEQKTVLEFLTSLKVGDYVVHNDHGIGKFIGVEKKTIDGIVKEYIHIQYAGNDQLFIPTDQAGKLSRYIVSDDEEPKLTKLDSGEWAKVSHAAKKEAEKIAKELLELYAKRRMSTRPKYLPDTREQEALETGFPYEETPGQLKAIAEVKKDMEKETPMDRLLCGDVGFGKTEVAVRAAFKAVASGKQVAFLSPVTILADQHYKTFSRRLDPFGTKVEVLSRFRTKKEQSETLARLAKGETQIIIGTHRLLQEDVKYKDLGLVIIDEEQKFGVKQKEQLKKLRTNVDILTMTATPIPRTLHLGLNRLRDISTITTPPPGRLPIITEVRKYGEMLIRDAVLFELNRGGQVFFLHNTVQTIEGLAEKLRMLIPEASIKVAHGQMDSDLLEERIQGFQNKQFNVLVSSTIIENGIDLPNANTLIVNDADEFGLSQLYQLRGRVGRGRTQAFTYLLYHGQRLSLEAKKRLRAIVEASELGSGFQIAMKDLEIRGAGDILGVSQHGVMKSVGVGHFIRLLNQTVEDMKSGRISEDLSGTAHEQENVTIELPLTSYIPETYISDYKEKIALYQKMSALETVQELHDLQRSVQDEYGALPNEVNNLFRVLEIKALARAAGLLSVRAYTQTLQEKTVELHLSKRVTPFQIMAVLRDDKRGAWTISGDKLKISMKNLGIDWYFGLVDNLRKLIAGKQQEAKEKDKAAKGPEVVKAAAVDAQG